MAEFLVIFACLNSTGCTETSSHYYNTHPHIKAFVEKNERLAREYVGSVVIDTYGPVLAIAAGGIGTIRLSKNFSLQGNRERVTIGFMKEF